MHLDSFEIKKVKEINGKIRITADFFLADATYKDVDKFVSSAASVFRAELEDQKNLFNFKNKGKGN